MKYLECPFSVTWYIYLRQMAIDAEWRSRARPKPYSGIKWINSHMWIQERKKFNKKLWALDIVLHWMTWGILAKPVLCRLHELVMLIVIVNTDEDEACYYSCSLVVPYLFLPGITLNFDPFKLYLVQKLCINFREGFDFTMAGWFTQVPEIFMKNLWIHWS